ncbi:hypothetical protein BH10BAC1_BH10BAC1_14990 [soil metagenome]
MLRSFFVYFYFMSKRYSLLLAFVLGLFCCLLLMLCYFNRLATDDYFFISDVRHHGVIVGVTSQYMEWCGRYAATFAMDVIYKAFDVNYAYYSIFPFISALLLFCGLYFLSNKLLAQIAKQQRLLAAGSFTALLFFFKSRYW